MVRHARVPLLVLNLLVALVLIASCAGPPATPAPPASPTTPPTETSTTAPAPQLSPTPEPLPTPATAPAPTPTPKPPPLPDLLWTGTLTLQPLAPVVGDKFHVKGTWRNAGSAATAPEFGIGLEVRRGNVPVFNQYVSVQQPVKPGEGRTLDIIAEYVVPEPGLYQIALVLDSKKVIAESREDNNTTVIDAMEVPDLSKEPQFNKEPDVAALAQAEKDIEKYRKGDVTLTIVDATGKPRPGLRVDYVQTRHSFLFLAYHRPPNERVWSLMKEAGINYVSIQTWWALVEPAPGVYRTPEGIDMLRKLNFAGYGHAFIFLYAKIPEFTPDYILRSTFEEFRNAVYPHIFRVVSAYKQDIKIWNVFNEPMWVDANILGLTSKQTIEIIKEGTRAIRDADQNARILINNYNVGGEISKGMNPYDFLKEAVQSNVDFDIIGLECYYNASLYGGWPDVQKGGKPMHLPRRTLTAMAELIDKYSTLGKKIMITEQSLPSNHPEGNQGYWGQLWSPQLQAEYVKAAYTLFFSKPQVEGIGWFQAADTAPTPFVYYGGLLDEQNRPKKSYYALKNLIRSWTTTGTGLTDNKGQVSFRGFGGTYEVTITDPKTGLSTKQEITVEEQKVNPITVTLR